MFLNRCAESLPRACQRAPHTQMQGNHLATGVPFRHTPAVPKQSALRRTIMKMHSKVFLGALLLAAVPAALAQSAATDTKNAADKTGHETKVVAKDAAKDTKKAADKTGHETKVVAKDAAKDTDKAAKKTGHGLKKATDATGHEIKKAGEKTEDAVK
jgi:hypothetical protein